MPDGQELAATWGPVLDGLYGARWREQREAWATPGRDVQQVVAEVQRGVHVNPTTVNFLADEGLIRITVVNDLPVTVEDLTLTLDPGNARLRITEQPESITIGPGSRANVQFRARALAAGEVPLEASLSTSNGTAIGKVELMQVRVQPTGVWIYWVMGGVAGVILVLGLIRSLRPRPAASASTSKEQE